MGSAERGVGAGRGVEDGGIGVLRWGSSDMPVSIILGYSPSSSGPLILRWSGFEPSSARFLLLEEVLDLPLGFVIGLAAVFSIVVGGRSFDRECGDMLGQLGEPLTVEENESDGVVVWLTE